MGAKNAGGGIRPVIGAALAWQRGRREKDGREGEGVL